MSSGVCTVAVKEVRCATLVDSSSICYLEKLASRAGAYVQVNEGDPITIIRRKLGVSGSITWLDYCPPFRLPYVANRHAYILNYFLLLCSVCLLTETRLGRLSCTYTLLTYVFLFLQAK